MAEIRVADPGDAARRPPGSTDVARLAGVSQKTVSRVMNNEPHVSSAVRDRVLAAARELGYRRNNAARALNLGRFQRIGMVSIGTSLYGPSTLLVALERGIRRAGYSLSVVSTLEGQAGGISDAVESLLDQGVDGIVLSEPIDEGEAVSLKDSVPVLSFGAMPGLDGPLVMVTGLDGVKSGRAATEHLLSLGHATVWHVAGPQSWWSARDRASGWRSALVDAGAPQPPIIAGDWSPGSGYAAGVQLARSGGVSAVFVANDDMAIGVLRGLAEAGLRVPNDVSVVGYDDIPAAAYLMPPLTTIRQDFEAVAARGLALLLERIGGPAERHQPADLPVRLVIRDSTAPPAAAVMRPRSAARIGAGSGARASARQPETEVDRTRTDAN
jgi:DNA-binding LacI/PurR family transcriptional regulator